MKKHNLLIPVTLGITTTQFTEWAKQMTNHFGSKNTVDGIDVNHAYFVINTEITEEDVKLAERLLSDICENVCDVMCIRGTEEAWDNITEGQDLLILDL